MDDGRRPPKNLHRQSIRPISDDDTHLSARRREQRLATLELQVSEVLRAESHAFTRAILDSLDTRAVAIDQDGTIVAANQAWLHPRRGGGAASIALPVGTNYLALCDQAGDADGGQLAAAAAGIRAVVQRRIARFQVDCHFEGSERWHTLTALPLDGLGGAVISHVDITDRRVQEAQVATAALHDPLTNLPNREHFLERLREAVAERSHRSGTVVLFIDLDRFKTVNDSLGHDAGDVVLRTVANLLRAALRPGDMVARLGGDEFVALCVDVADVEQGRELAERLLQAVEAPIVVGDARVIVHASIGGTMADAGVDDVENLVREADAAMYRAKALGRRRVEFLDEGVRRRDRERRRVGDGVRDALHNREFSIAYQPVVTLSTGRILGAEALLRWRRSDGMMVSPTVFIPVAEETGTIEAIGRWVLVNACADMVGLMQPQRRVPGLGLSINLSGVQLARPGFCEDLAESLSATGWNPTDLCVEITETALMRDVVAAARNLDGLRNLGVRVALDDFGTGYSTLLYAKHFRVDMIKVDRAFVAGVGRDGPDKAIVQSVIGLAHSLGARVVAEGVETQAQVSALKSLGCDFAQGYYFARPLTFDAFTQLCAKEQRLWEEQCATPAAAVPAATAAVPAA